MDDTNPEHITSCPHMYSPSISKEKVKFIFFVELGQGKNSINLQCRYPDAIKKLVWAKNVQCDALDRKWHLPLRSGNAR